MDTGHWRVCRFKTCSSFQVSLEHCDTQGLLPSQTDFSLLMVTTKVSQEACVVGLVWERRVVCFGFLVWFWFGVCFLIFFLVGHFLFGVFFCFGWLFFFTLRPHLNHAPSLHEQHCYLVALQLFGSYLYGSMAFFCVSKHYLLASIQPEFWQPFHPFLTTFSSFLVGHKNPGCWSIRKNSQFLLCSGPWALQCSWLALPVVWETQACYLSKTIFN